MRLGRLLFQNGYTRTVARKSGEVSRLVRGAFNPEAPFGDGGPDTLLTRYGIVREETAGTVQGEAANVDPDVIARWLADPQGGGSGVIPRTAPINPPDEIDVVDLRYISRDGQNTAFGELIEPWLARQRGSGTGTGGEVEGDTKTASSRLAPGEIVHYVDPETGAHLPALAYGTGSGEGAAATSLLRVLRPKAVGEDFDVSAPQDASGGSKGSWHRPEPS